jgi:glycosyltransferase involved in cell wall biosynthesis
MIKVLHLAAGVGPDWYGIGVGLDDLCRAIAALGCEVVLATAYRSVRDDPERLLPPITEGDGRYSRVAFPVLVTKRFQFSPALLRWLLANISGFDIVHVNSLYSFPVVAGLVIARALNIPYVVTTHDVLAPIQRRKSRRKKLLADWMLIRRALDSAAAIVYSTAGECDAAQSLRIRASSAIIPWGINLKPFALLPKRGNFRARFLNGSDCPLVLYLGRLAEKKGLDRLLEAFKKVVAVRPDARLVIAGGGDPPEYRRLVERWAEEQGVSQRVLFTGLLYEANKLAVLADADVFVLPSHSENFAVAMFEAMACRLPVVISSGIQLSGDIARSGAGLVGDDSSEIADAICRILSDCDLRCRLGELGFAYASQFRWENTAGALASLYRQILSSKAGFKRLLRSDGSPARSA